MAKTARIVAVGLVGAWLTVTASAAAQNEGFSLERFDPAPAGDAFFGVASPFVVTDLRPSFVVEADYAHAPLVLRRTNGDDIGKIVSDQLFLHAAGSIAVGGRVLFHADVPFAVATSGQSPSFAGTTFGSPSGAAMGDVRLGARLRIVGGFDDPVQLSINGSVWLPTGKQDAYAGDGQTHVLPSVIVGGRIADIVWTSTLGVHLRAEREVLATPVRNEATFGAGVAYLAAHDTVQIGPEIYGTTAVGGDTTFFGKRTTTAELLLGAKYRPGPWVVGIAGGPGIGRGLGTPDVRGVVLVGYAPWGEEKKAQPPPAEPDQDVDTIVDREDACPQVPGVRNADPKKNGCPADKDDDGIVDDKDACPTVPGVANPDPKKNGCPADQDDDGIADKDDACPTVPGVADPDPKKNGCPPDQDNDGIADKDDACPTVAGVADPDPKKNGCPPDKDGDGIVDKEDACPDVPGSPDPDPKKNGCPKVILTKKAIVITEQIHFEYNKANILPDSDTLLGQIAQVMKDHPEIKKIQIEGHTDNVGGAAFNQGLSQKRADAVKKWLVDHGIDKDRFVTKGFGLTKPLADNKTPEGREKNRRVEFNILEPKPGKDEK